MKSAFGQASAPGTHRAIKDRLLTEFARVGKAVASPKRIELMDLLAQGERSVEALAAEAEMSIKNASAHLRVLRTARLVETRSEGTYVFYRLATGVDRFLRELEDLGRDRLAEIERLVEEFYADPDGLEPVDAEDLLERARAGEVLVLDVRPPEEYQAGHVPGALSVPLDELERRLSDFGRDRDIVAYCRGPYCLFSVEAVGLLRARGFRAWRMEVGLPEWRERGLPVAAGAKPGLGFFEAKGEES